MKTFQDYAAAFPDEDPLKVIKSYSDDAKLELMDSDEYDDDLINEIDGQLLQHAVNQGYVTPEDPSPFFKREADQELGFVATYAEDPLIRSAAAKYRALQDTKSQWADSPEEYEVQLEQAKLAYSSAATPEVRDQATADALRYGHVPFATRKDVDGNDRLEISPQLREIAGDDAALAQLFRADPSLDRTKIPELRRQLATPEGYAVPQFVLGRRDDFNQAVTGLAAKDPRLVEKLNQLRSAVDGGKSDNLDPGLRDINTILQNYGINEKFSEQEQADFLKDYLVSTTAPKVNDQDVDANLATLSTGEVHVPLGVMLNRPLFERTLAESTRIPAAQKESLAASRDSRLEAFAKDAFSVIAAKRPEFTKFYDERKSKGATDSAVLDEWMENPDNYSSFRDYAAGVGESVVEGFGGLLLYPAALAGNESARGALAELQKSDSDRRAYARLFGQNLGVGYDVARLVAPVAADVGVSLLTAGAAAPLVTAKTTAREAIKSTLRTALSSETKSLLGNFTRAAAARGAGGAANLAGKTVDEALTFAGRDIARNLTKSATTASYLATAFNRSAGATYVQLHSALESQKNADGSPKYSPQEAREIALNHGLLAGTITAAVTGGFSFLGAAGMEKIYDGMTRRQLTGVFDRLKRDFGKLSPAAREGLDMTNASTMLESVVRKSVAPMWQSVGKPIKDEAAEEGLDEFLQYFNQQTATGEKVNISDAVKQASYASFLGGLMGGTVTGINSVARGATPSAPAEQTVRRQALLETASKLDAAASPQSAAVVRELALQGIPTEESVPEGEDPAGDEPTSGDAGVVEDDPTVPLREELAAVKEEVAGLAASPSGESAGQKARRMRRLNAATAREASLTQTLSTYDPQTILVAEPERQKRLGPGATELPSGPVIPLGPSGDPAGLASTNLDMGIPVSDNAEFEELQRLMERRGQAQNKVKGAKFTAKDDKRFTQLSLQFRDQLFERTDPQNDPVVGKDINGANIQQSSQGTFYTFENGRVRTGPSFSPETPAPEIQNTDFAMQSFDQLAGPDLDRVAENLGMKRRGFRDEQLRAQIQKNFAPEEIEEARSFAREIPVADVFYDAQPGDALTPEQAMVVTDVLDAPNPEVAVAARRETADAYLQSKGIVTDGLSDADAAVLLNAASAEGPVAAARGETAPPAKRADMTELETHRLSEGSPVFLDSVAKTGPKPLRNVARLLMKFPEIPVTVVDLPGASFAGAYVPSTGQVLVNSARGGPRGSVDTVLHEMLHAATEASIANPTPEQAKILKRLDRIRKTVAKKATGDLQYGLSNNAEFITHAFTSPEFMQQVAELTPKDERNWAQVIIDTIRDLLNGRADAANQRINEGVMNDLLAFTDIAAGTWGTPRMDQVVARPGIKEQPAADPEPTLETETPAEDGFSYSPVQVRTIAEGLAPEGVELSIDYDELARDLEDVNPMEAEDLVAAMVNRDVAEQAGLDAVGEVTEDEQDRFRESLTGAITGNSSDQMIGFYRTNPDALSKWVRYAEAGFKALWERLKTRFDNRSAVYTDRLGREIVRARDGYQTRGDIKQFNPESPEETAAMVRFQPAEGDPSPNSFTNFVTVLDGNKLYNPTPEEKVKPGWFTRMFARRDDLAPSISAIKTDTEAKKAVIQHKFDRLNKDYEKALKKENPDMEVLKQAIGSTAPLLTPDEETRINEAMEHRLADAAGIAEPRIAAARVERDKAVRRATDEAGKDAARETFRQEEAAAKVDQAKAIDEAMDWQREEVDRSKIERANELRRVQSLAMQQLEVNSPLTWKWANEMRETTNELQDFLADWYRESRPELSATIDRSRGVYLVRSYRFHQDPAMGEMVLHDSKFADLRERAIGYFGKDLAEDKYQELRSRPENANMPEDVLRQVAAQDVEEQARLLFEDFVMGHENLTTGGVSNNIKTEFQRFMQKKNQDPMIAEILGEIDDPLFNAGRTLSAVSNILFSQKMLAAVKKNGLESGDIITQAEKEANPSKYRAWKPLVASDAHSQAYAPLAGYYASPETKEAWDAALNAGRNNAKDTAGRASDFLNKLILGSAGASLGVATLGSPGYQVRNIAGGILMALAQGVNVFSPKGIKSVKTSFNKAFGNQGDQEFIEKMIAYRVLGDGAQITYLRDFLKKYREDPIGALDWAAEKGMEISPEAVKALGKGKHGWDKMVEFLSRSAEFTETIPNVAIYLNELQAMVDSGLYATQGEAEQEAARRTKMVTPSKTETSQAVTAFTKNPISALILPFARFKTEMMRTVWNTYKLGIEDVKRGRAENNEVLLQHGIARLSSAVMIHGGLTVLIPLVLQRLSGISDEEDKAIRAAMPSYSKNSSFWYQRKGDGTLRTWDMTFTNPFSFVLDPMTQMIKASNSRDLSEVPQIIKRFVTEEFLGENILAGNVLDVNRNLDETTGMPIWLETDELHERVAKGTAHIVGGSYTPAVAKKIYQAYIAGQRPSKEDDPFFYTPAGILLGSVAPTKPRDHEIDKLAYRAFRNLSKKNSELWMLTNPLSSPQGMPEGEATKIYHERVNGAVKVWGEAHRLAKAYRKMGMSKRQIIESMKEAGLSKERSLKAYDGKTDRPVIDSKKLKDIREIDPARHDEVVRAMKRQARIIDLR